MVSPSGMPDSPDGPEVLEPQSYLPPDSDRRPLKVVIAGGGVAAIETTLALRDLACELVQLTLIAPTDEFVYRPMVVREPFAYAAVERYSLPWIAADLDAELLRDSFSWVDSSDRVAHTAQRRALPYDALVLCLGAHRRACYEHAITLEDRRLDELLHGLIQDVEGGYVKRLAFVAPERIAWPLPLYELALLTATRAAEMNVELEMTILTPEQAPLEIFGEEAGRGVSALLRDTGIGVLTGAVCEIPTPGRIVINRGQATLAADRIVALPELFGPHARGLPMAPGGFIPINANCEVRDVARVYAAGDATDFAIRHGGLAAQQADTVAREIAARAGVPVVRRPFRPVLHGMLLTGGRPRYLSAQLSGGHGFRSRISERPIWSPPAKIDAEYLAPYLEQIGAGRAFSGR